MTKAMELIREQGIKTSDGHDYVDFDQTAYESQLRRFREGGSKRYRVSPDIVHMLVDGHPSASELGYELICDPELPHDTVATP
jgi:hypothetical protein